eukprot:COSAG01_NODE_122_length_25212_cov_25.945646_8_plen_98_part_00
MTTRGTRASYLCGYGNAAISTPTELATTAPFSLEAAPWYMWAAQALSHACGCSWRYSWTPPRRRHRYEYVAPTHTGASPRIDHGARPRVTCKSPKIG